MSRFQTSVVVLLAAIAFLSWRLMQFSAPRFRSAENPGSLVLYCAAGMRVPVEKIVADYRREYGVIIEVQYGGSNSLLSQIELAHTGDLYLAADDSYLELARQRGLVAEEISVAFIRPVIAVAPGNPRNIHGIGDLLRDDVKTALGNPDQAAIGEMTRRLLQPSGKWKLLEQRVTATGVFHPTVPEVANDVKLGSVDAGIVWDTTVHQLGSVEMVRTPELDAGRASVAMGVLTSCESPSAALRFARYVTARDRGLWHFAQQGYEVIDGDAWEEYPRLTFFCGAVNRRAVEQVVAEFQAREGVEVNTVYNGCGMLTASMRGIRDQQAGAGFPDTYMACDRYYLDTVQEWFQDDLDISDTEVVIAVPKGNPKQIHSVQDLAQPGVRVTLGQPDQCTIGVLTRQLLRATQMEEAIMANVVQESSSSGLLIPTVVTGAADATFAYLTDTLSERDKIDVVRVAVKEAMAVQPFAIARSSPMKQLSRRLLRKLMQSRAAFEKAGFHFRVPDEFVLQTDAELSARP